MRHHCWHSRLASLYFPACSESAYLPIWKLPEIRSRNVVDCCFHHYGRVHTRFCCKPERCRMNNRSSTKCFANATRASAESHEQSHLHGEPARNSGQHRVAWSCPAEHTHTHTHTHRGKDMTTHSHTFTTQSYEVPPPSRAEHPCGLYGFFML